MGSRVAAQDPPHALLVGFPQSRVQVSSFRVFGFRGQTRDDLSCALVVPSEHASHHDKVSATPECLGDVTRTCAATIRNNASPQSVSGVGALDDGRQLRQSYGENNRQTTMPFLANLRGVLGSNHTDFHECTCVPAGCQPNLKFILLPGGILRPSACASCTLIRARCRP